MRTEAKAIVSKPPVSFTRATGTVTFKADDLLESAILTALVKTILHGKYPELANALSVAAKEEYAQMSQGTEFVMRLPTSPKGR